tara:strand:- start:1300 stop:1650 length:351 start_codon:yes stop_codon:yes gene_type:complete
MCQKKNKIMLQRLKGRSKTKSVFENGKNYHYQNLLLRLEKDSCLSFLAVGVSVSKKDFSRAVDRNRIKRKLRIALNEVKHNILFCGYCMVFYVGKKMPEKGEIVEQIKGVLEKVNN